MLRILLRRGIFVLGLAAWAVPAWAHAILIESAPAAGSVVSPGETAVSLKFNSRIDARRSRVTLVGADGAAVILPVTADAVGVVLRGSAVLVPGEQVVRWQVLAIDGHITRGEFHFSVGPR